MSDHHISYVISYARRSTRVADRRRAWRSNPCLSKYPWPCRSSIRSSNPCVRVSYCLSVNRCCRRQILTLVHCPSPFSRTSLIAQSLHFPVSGVPNVRSTTDLTEDCVSTLKIFTFLLFGQQHSLRYRMDQDAETYSSMPLYSSRQTFTAR